jgi:hypothetical protein
MFEAMAGKTCRMSHLVPEFGHRPCIPKTFLIIVTLRWVGTWEYKGMASTGVCGDTVSRDNRKQSEVMRRSEKTRCYINS